MGSQSERRNLYYEENDQYDPLISVDVNEYLIECWPTLTLKQRTSVWTLCQNDEEFDYTSVHDQIDDHVYKLAESDSEVNLGDDSSDYEEYDDDENDDDTDDEDESLDGYLIVDVVTYLSDKYPNITEEQLFEISDHMNSDEAFSWDALYTYMDFYVKQYACEVDNTINLEESSDEAE
jgi:hypothetical protein|tara:strand:- start:580 stop:1113 length:534 start_codon:yes stop_codon:yes gene_type:complete